MADEAKASLARHSALMASGTLVSRVLGFARVVVLAAAVGASAQSVGGQVFDLANKAPNVFYMLLAGGVLNAVLVPQIMRSFKMPDGGREYLDRLVTLALLVMGGATLVLTLAAPLVVRLYSEGWPGDWLALATLMAFWCLPQVFCYGLYTVLGQVLNAHSRFGAYMWAPALNNVVAIAAVGAFLVLYPGAASLEPGAWTPGMVALLAGGHTAGVAAQALVLLVPLRRAGFRYRPRLGFRGMGLGTAGKVAGWTFAGVAVGQLAFLLTSRVMTGAGAALEAAGRDGAAGPSYTNAYLLFMLPHSIVAVSLVTALFTRISGAAADGAVRAVRRDFSSGARTVAAAGALATTAFVVLGRPIGVTLFGEDGRWIGEVLVAMAVGLVPFGVTYLVQRVFYAYEDARTPFVVSVVVAAVTTAGNVAIWLLVEPRWQVVGIGVVMSTANVVGCALSLVLLRRRLRALDGGGVDGHRLLRTGVRLAIISAVSGGLVWAAARALTALLGAGAAGSLAVTVAGGALLLVVFTALCRLMRVHELTDLVTPLLRRVHR
ncbi:hypothetical protein GCM10023225_11850 [Kineococcus glutinatus]|uniref:Peptidoglycan lipid II flippase n=1 Tax=Kineococcus glutinatus TaxID=1070872 RepID=A0ABP9HII2_9ACTN